VRPAQLTSESFKAYPPEGRALAVANLALLQELPLGFTPFLLREIIVHDWKFPYERAEMTAQLSYLSKLWPQQRQREMEPFTKLQLTDKLENSDWVNQPAQFLEQLSAHLWATKQMDGFREASENYVRKFNGTLPAEELPVPRLGVAVFGEGVSATRNGKIGIHGRILHVVHGASRDVTVAVTRKHAGRVNTRRAAVSVARTAEYIGVACD